MDVVEKMAMAIYEQRNGFGAVPWGRRDEAHQRPYLADAKAALEAIHTHLMAHEQHHRLDAALATPQGRER